MAKLSANGKVVGQIDHLIYSDRYMSNGAVLRSRAGGGWKHHRKIDDGAAPEDEFRVRAEKATAFREKRPAYTAYKAKLHELAPLSQRALLHDAVTMMPDDYDGVWSQMCDKRGPNNIDADVDDIAKLCESYKLYKTEYEAERAQRKAEREAKDDQPPKKAVRHRV